MPNNDANKVVIFSRDTSPIISEIITKYNLRETQEDAIETVKNGKLFRAGIIFNIVEKIILNSELKKDIISILQKELNISGDVANNMAKDIENELLTIGKLVSSEEFIQLNKKNAETKINTEEGEKPITFIPASPAKRDALSPKKSARTKKPIVPEEIKKPKPQTRPRSGSDNYREPIN